MSRVWGCEASQGVAQVSAERELSYIGLRQSRTRRCRRVKAARECGEVGRGYTEPAGRVVASDRKQSRTLRRGAKLRGGGHLGWERVEFELLRPRATEPPERAEPDSGAGMWRLESVQSADRIPGTYDFVKVVKALLSV
ncbi:hypothetical protein EDB85DRAFT_2279856 [Lactarius pseudohatsudake]|nr:hypothetical protein EDB85DRAFT_2279856 [Lactarius pseudohatsudake]